MRIPVIDWISATVIGPVKKGLALRFLGGTSGTVDVKAPATVTSWTFTWPSAAPAGSAYKMVAGTDGVASWAADSGGSGPWTDGTGITYLTDTAEDLAVGGSTVTGSPFGVDVSAGAIYGGLTTSAGMTFYSRMTASYPYTGAFTFDCAGAIGDYTGIVVKKGGTRLWDIGSWDPSWSASMEGRYGGGDGSGSLISCKSSGVGVGSTGGGGWALGFVRWSTNWKPVLWAEESGATMGCRVDLGVEAEKLLVLDCALPTNVNGTASAYVTPGVTGSVASTLVQTTNNTATTLIARTLNDNTVYRIEAEVAARRTDAAGRGCYTRSVLVYRAGGSATIEGSVATIGTDVENGITCTVTLDVSGNDVRLRVTGETGKTIKWKGTLRIVAAG